MTLPPLAKAAALAPATRCTANTTNPSSYHASEVYDRVLCQNFNSCPLERSSHAAG